MSRFQQISARLARRSKMARELALGLTWPPFTSDLPLAELQRRYELPSSRYLEVDDPPKAGVAMEVDDPPKVGVAMEADDPPKAGVAMEADDPPKAGVAMEANGLRVHVTDEGSGPVLVLVHGLMASLHTWDGWVEQLRDSFRIVRLDLPGFGLTGPDPERRYDGAGLLKIFDKLREQLGIERMFLAGSSLGGFVSWYYAVHHPERVDKLVLIDPLAYVMEPLPFIRLLGTPAGRWLGQRLDPRGSVARGVYDVFGDPQRVSAAAIRRYQDLALRPGNRRALIDFCAEFMRMHEHNPYEADVARLGVPTLLMWGDQDRWIPPSHVKLWQRDVPGIEVQIYEGAGHVPMEELPERTARDAREFFLRR